MEKAFIQFIKDEELFSSSDPILLAISGGVDSMVLLDLFRKFKFRFGVAHCNFQLRGEDSDQDARFVKDRCAQLGIPFYFRKFDTIQASENRKKSIEMTARELRYEWFAELLDTLDYKYLATAHHLNDSLETLIYNLVKGTGIRGLHGIPVKNGTIIRPLSFASRAQIEEYASGFGITFREDATNNDISPRRNLIRHKVIPHLREINPSLERTFLRTLKNIRETEILFDHAVDQQRKKLLLREGEQVKIAINLLQKQPAKATLLYELICDQGFNADHVDQIFNSINTVGARFYSGTHLILVERKYLLIQPKTSSQKFYREFMRFPNQIKINENRILFIEELPYVPANKDQGKNVALIDAGKLDFPLIIRTWKEGDRFQPIGMEGKHKKIKAFLRDEKVNLLEKEKVLVLESAGRIVWVIGHRQDERFKLDEQSGQTLRIHWEKV